MRDILDIASSKAGEIWVHEFTPESAAEFRERILSASKADTTKPLVIYIDSYGGQLDALTTMIETLDETPNPIITVCLGKSMSCGAILLSHGDIRFCGPHSRIMIHEVSSGTHGDVHDMFADAIETKRLNELFLGLLAKNCGMKGGYNELRKRIKEQDGRDKYMNAAEAKEFGIIDVIGKPRVNTVTVHEVSVAKEKRSSVSGPVKTTKKTNKKSKSK